MQVVHFCRGIVPGGAGGAMTPPDFGRSVHPISTRGTDYAHLITTDTPGFSDLPTALFSTIHWNTNDSYYVILKYPYIEVLINTLDYLISAQYGISSCIFP